MQPLIAFRIILFYTANTKFTAVCNYQIISHETIFNENNLRSSDKAANFALEIKQQPTLKKQHNHDNNNQQRNDNECN